MKTDNLIKIIWNDAVLLSPRVKTRKLSKMETTGFLLKEEKDFFIISKPKTRKIDTNQKYPEAQPTFYFIPKGMVEKVERISQQPL